LSTLPVIVNLEATSNRAAYLFVISVVQVGLRSRACQFHLDPVMGREASHQLVALRLPAFGSRILTALTLHDDQQWHAARS
jgi:hypothetical protein